VYHFWGELIGLGFSGMAEIAASLSPSMTSRTSFVFSASRTMHEVSKLRGAFEVM
jgi:hypothetical protein